MQRVLQRKFKMEGIREKQKAPIRGQSLGLKSRTAAQIHYLRGERSRVGHNKRKSNCIT